MFSRIGLAGALAIGVLAAAIPASAQSTPPVRSLAPLKSRAPVRGEVPASYLPPSGMCRIWIDNVPPAQQPAPTDCASAIKHRPSNGRVIFPEDGARSGKNAKGEVDAKRKDRDTKRKPKRPSE